MGILRKKYIGDKAFYNMVLGIVVPMIIQKGISNFVSLLDNIMVGKTGTEQMAGVAIANQLLFVFYLCIFGAVSGVGIFTAQYFGSGNLEGVRNTLQLKLIINTLLAFVAIYVFVAYGGMLIRTYLSSSQDCEDLDAAFRYGKQYMLIMMIGILPFTWSQSLSSTLRECGQTVVPMISSVTAVFTNTFLNLILIFGLLGAPKLGVMGAAIATVISRFVELLVLIVWLIYANKDMPYFKGTFTTFRIPKKLVWSVIITGTPLMVNETVWAAVQAFVNQFYSTRGLSVVAAINIASTISNLFYVVYFSIGESIAIIVGQQLGVNDMEKAVDWDRKLIFTSVASCLVIGAIMCVVAPFFPELYKTEPVVKDIAKRLIIVCGIMMPIQAFEHAAYFTIRSGGRTFITFLFDSMFAMCVNIPTAFMLSHFTSLPIIPLYALCQSVELIKCIIGYTLVKKRIWLKNIVNN